MRVLVIARRELASYACAPLAYVVGAAFLVVQGLSFWALVDLLADPERSPPYGAVLEGYFGGTLLSWAVLLATIAAISMRTIAEEKRSGTWEMLYTTGVGEGTVVLGKWLGALTFYCLLWLPTLGFPAVLALYAPGDVSVDWGPVAAAYLGVLASGAALTALGIAASAATSNQITAAVLAFFGCMTLLLVGQMRELAPSWLRSHPSVASVAAFIDPRGHVQSLAGGTIRGEPLLFFAALAAVALALATVASSAGRRTRDEVGRRAISSVLLLVIGICAAILTTRHPISWDVTRGRVNSLDGRALAVLESIPEPVDVLVVRAADQRYDRVFDEIEAVLDRMVRAQPLLRRHDVDPDQLAALSRELAIAPDDLRDGGGVIFQIGRRRRGLDLLQMASFGSDPLGASRIASFPAEEAFSSALLQLTTGDRPMVCATGGHGELALQATPKRRHWGGIGDRLRRDGYRIERLGTLTAGVPAYCRVVLVAGIERRFEPSEAGAIARYLAAGGRLLLAVDAPLLPGSPDETGLERALAELGVTLPAAAALDPDARSDMPLVWVTSEGCGDHPVSSAFQGRRVTAWRAPRPVQIAPGAGRRSAVLVRTGPSGWAERDLGALRSTSLLARPDDADIRGPVSIAAAVEVPATGARVVIIGSARSLSSELAERGFVGGELLAFSSLAWLTNRSISVAIGDKRPEHLRLIMTGNQRRGVFAFYVVFIPLLFLGLGAGSWWRRRGG